MQTEEQQIFRFNWQVGVILAITAVALIIPLIGVGFLAHALLNPKTVPIVAQPEPPFRKSLEDLANEKLGAAIGLSVGANSLKLSSKDVLAEVARVEALARAAGGSTLPPEQIGEGTRLTVQIPRNQLESFRQACQNPQSTLVQSAPDPSTELLEIVIQKEP